MCMYPLVCLVNKYLSNCSSTWLKNSVSCISKMADTDAEVLVGNGAENGADASQQEEADNTNASRSTNASEVPPEDSQVPRDEEEEDESEEDGRASTQVYKRPAGKKGPQMTMSEVQEGMLHNNSKLAEEISNVRKRKEELRKARQEEAKKEKQQRVKSSASKKKLTCFRIMT